MALETPVVDLSYKRGDSRPIPFALTKADGSIQDLTGYSAAVLSVHSEPKPPDTSTELFKVTGTIVAAAGTISFSPAEDATGSDQEPGRYYYDAQVLDANSKKLTFAEGTFTLTQDRAKD